MEVFTSLIPTKKDEHPLIYLDGCRLEKCAAIVVVFFPGPQEFENIARIAQQFGLLIIVINGLTEAGWEIINTKLLENKNILLRDSGGNIGIAAALNSGVVIARENEFSWVATFDQDSSIDSNFARSVSDNIQMLASLSDVGLVAPVHVGKKNGDFVGYCPIINEHKNWSEIRSVITSGNMISIDAWDKVNGFFDELFIDQVDYEYCFRLRKAKFRLILLREVKMQHDIGDPAHVSLFGFNIPLDGHGPTRYYYMFRNLLIIFPKYVFFEPWFFIRTTFLLTVKATLLIVFEKRRFHYFSNICHGLFDAIRGRSGSLDVCKDLPEN